MKKLLMIMVLTLLVGCSQAPAAEKEKQVRTCTYSIESQEPLKNEGLVTFTIDTTSETYANGDYIVFVENTDVFHLDAPTKEALIKDYSSLEQFAKTRIRWNYSYDKRVSTQSKYQVFDDKIVIVVRTTSPQEPTGWRSWIPDPDYAFDQKKSPEYPFEVECRVESIPNLPGWTDRIESIGGDNHDV